MWEHQHRHHKTHEGDIHWGITSYSGVNKLKMFCIQIRSMCKNICLLISKTLEIRLWVQAIQWKYPFPLSWWMNFGYCPGEVFISMRRKFPLSGCRNFASCLRDVFISMRNQFPLSWWRIIGYGTRDVFISTRNKLRCSERF